MTSVVDHFPAHWRTTVTVVRGGGRDPVTGDPTPSTETPLDECLLAPRTTADPIDRADLTEATGALYRRHGFQFRPTDRIRVPEGATLAAGMWAVDGEPNTWPMGVEVPLRKDR